MRQISDRGTIYHRLMPSKVLFGVALVACLASSEARLSACTCRLASSPCVAAGNARAVFVGQVVEITNVDPGALQAPPSLPFSRRIAFKVTESLRGELGDSVIVYTGSGGGDCGFQFSKGKSYLVYASALDREPLTTSTCSRTREAGRGAEGEIKELRALAKEPRKCLQQ